MLRVGSEGYLCSHVWLFELLGFRRSTTRLDRQMLVLLVVVSETTAMYFRCVIHIAM